MYCGSCARDNALAAELLKRGHDLTLVPVYTPTRTDEPNVSRSHVLFGGISVYLQQYASVFRKTPRILDRLWDAPGVIAAFAGRMVSNDPRMLGDLTLSMLQGDRSVLRKEFDKLLDWIHREPLPDIINLPNSLLIALAEPLKKALNRPVCCTLQGEELFIEGLAPAYREKTLELIRNQVQHVDRFLAVSRYCSTFMTRYLQIPAAKVAVVPLGINVSGYERRSPRAGSDEPFTIGYFARVAPEKGLHVLADAYLRFRRRTAPTKARLEAAGYASPVHAGYLQGVVRKLEAEGFGDEFVYRGVVDRAGKLKFLGGLDLLSVPATYDEPKGMFLLEAMARGVPVVQPQRGAFTEVVEATKGGILVKPDDPEALSNTFHDLWNDRLRIDQLGGMAFNNVRQHYTVERSADQLLEVYGDVLQGAERQRALG
jgi:glycosyltransferase involved in cell wall biosynthesis